MTKAELINAVAQKTELSKKDSEKAVVAVIDAISEALAAGEKVALVGFGTFEVKERAAREGINPRTKEKIEIPASKLPVFKKAHLVVASGLDVLRALALCKPCVVLGDYGLGGFVTPENFEQLHSVSFAGRKGAAWGEFVPGDLLETEIRKVFFTDYREQVRALQQQVKELYSKKQFADRLTAEVERIVSLSALLKDRKRRLELKPFRSSLFEIKEVEGKRYLMRGWQCFGEVEEEMAQLLMQCDGTRSVQELVARNGYDREEASVLWANLQALWNEKLILFAL